MIKKLILLAALFSSNIFAQSVVVGFTRSEVSAKKIVEQAIQDAKISLKVAAYQLTSQDIIDLIVDAKNKGVEVNVVIDRTQANGIAQSIFVKNKIGCYVDQKHKIMHHKFLIIDGKNLQTGSFNYTKNAETRNAENAVYLIEYPYIANQYDKEFERIKATAINCKG